MITKPTVLILGAGAGVPYGFPSGQGLMEETLDELRPDKRSELFNTLIKFDIKCDEIDEFYRNLSQSGMLSVDAFLEHQTKFMRAGRLAITLILSLYEDEKKLFSPEIRGKSWHEYLWNKLNAPFDDFDKNRLSIITFNYDRSIEHYLITVMMRLYGKSEEDCGKALNKIPIIHVHGKLGALPWQESEEELVRSYNPGIYHDQIENISEQIIVIPEQEVTSGEFRESYKIMDSASEIYFLGFGYHPANLQRLKIKEFGRKHPMGSTYNMGKAEREGIRGWGIKVEEDFNEILDYLRNHVILR